MTVETVDAGVDRAADEPLRVRRLPVEHAVPGTRPLELAGKSRPERFRIAFGVGVDGSRRDTCARLRKSGERRKRAIFAEQIVVFGGFVCRSWPGRIAYRRRRAGVSPGSDCVKGDVDRSGRRRRRRLPEERRTQQPAEGRERGTGEQHETGSRARCRDAGTGGAVRCSRANSGGMLPLACDSRSKNARCERATSACVMGIDSNSETKRRRTPARSPTSAPSPAVIGSG